MCDNVCVLCFSFATVTYNIKNTQLQNVYEEISETKIRADSYPLCYICYAKLFKLEQLLKSAQQHNNSNTNQAQMRPLLHLSMLNTDSWSTSGQIDSGKIEIEVQIEINQPHIKKENVDDVGYYDDSSTSQQDKQFSSDPTRKRNKREFVFVCNICEKTFSYANNFKKHQKTCTGVKSKLCRICKKTFTSNHFKKHQLTCTGVKIYRCEICCMSFTHNYIFERHKLIHSDEKPYTCDVCSNKYKRKKDLKVHIKMKHSANGKKSLPDDKSNIIDNSWDLTKRYACDVCKMRFAYLCRLKKHQNIKHTNIRAYTCDECGKNFYLLDVLKRHHLTHSKVRPFRCDVCPKAYKTKYDLHRHKRKAVCQLHAVTGKEIILD